MNWKRYVRKLSLPNLGYYPGICVGGQRKTTKNLSHYRWYQGRDLNSEPPEYEEGELTSQPHGV
jgi:hypothetical protein